MIVRGFTLIELLTALLMLSLLGLMSYRSLAAVLNAREHVARETAKWRSLESFFARFERDVQRASTRPARGSSADAPAWRGLRAEASVLRLELTRLGGADGNGAPRRIGYAVNGTGEVELWLWAAPDGGSDMQPARYRLLSGVKRFDVDYLGARLEWVDAWPAPDTKRALPLAVRVRLVLSSGEEIVRVFALT